MTCGGMLIKNRFSQKHPFRLTPEESLSKTSSRRNTGLIDYIRILWTLRSDDGDGNENVIKAIGLSKTITLHVHHTFLYISLPFLQDYDVKMPFHIL